MEEPLVHIDRIDADDKQTLSELRIVGHEFTCKVLELVWKDNQKRISCIPTGDYEVSKRWSEKYGSHFIVLNVPNRSYILWHYGNFHKNTLGCLLMGKSFMDINGDGYRDVTSSKYTMTELYKILPERFVMSIC